MKTRGRPISRSGIEIRRTIRADFDANPASTHQDLRRKFGVAQSIIESAMTKTVAEWDACVEKITTPEPLGRTSKPAPPKPMPATLPDTLVHARPPTAPPPVKLPGLEQGFVKFTRKPARMGEDHIFWIPRVYIRNGLVDPDAEYEVYLKKVPKKES